MSLDENSKTFVKHIIDSEATMITEMAIHPSYMAQLAVL